MPQLICVQRLNALASHIAICRTVHSSAFVHTMERPCSTHMHHVECVWIPFRDGGLVTPQIKSIPYSIIL